MSRRGLLLLWLALAVLAHVLPVGPRARAELPEESPRTLHYEIDAALDAERHVIEATGRLTWRNQTSGPAHDLHLHLYLNAFEGPHTTFMRESRGRHRGHEFDERAPGGIELTRLVREGGGDLLAGASFEPCDDGNPEDRTVLVVPLDEPIPPGGEATFELAWTSRLPRVFARTGFGGPFHMAAQWYPKPGVFEPDPAGGGMRWNCHQFHGSSEFYSDYGTYDVQITVPEAYEGRVGATGVPVGEARRGEDGALTYRFRADDVHDFAWTCDDDYVVREYEFPGGAGTAPEAVARLAEVLGRSDAALALTPVRVRLLLQPEHADQAERHRDAVFHALSWMGAWFGRYPYPMLTVVDPDHRARDAGGMEYPMLITGGTRYVIDEDGWTPQFVLVHEFGHQHFYGLIGTNEFEHAWMDEGMTTWATARTLAAAYGDRPARTWYAGLPVAGERPLGYAGWVETAPRAFPFVVPAIREHAHLPFGRLGVVRGVAAFLGVEAPETIGLWPEGVGAATPLAFLREAPPFSLLEPLPLSVREAERTRQAAADLVDPIAGTFAWHHVDRGSYGLNSYRRTANALRTLEALMGEAAMLRAVRTYAERHRFGHPVPADLFAAFREAADEDIDWYLEEAFRTTHELDFGIEAIREVALGEEAAGVEHHVIVRRHGAMRYPIDILVAFEDGRRQRLRWGRDDGLEVLGTDGEGEAVAAPARLAPARAEQGRWVGLRYPAGLAVGAALVDPHRRVDLDGDRTNDGRRRQRAASAAGVLALRVLGWVEMSTTFYGGL